MLEIYENIRKFRRSYGWTQDELARKVGYGDRSTISRIERGDIDLPQSMIIKFANAFGVAPKELMGSDNWRISIGAHVPIMSCEKYLRILDIFNSNKFVKHSKHETTLLKGVLRCKCGRLFILARKTKADGTISTWYHCPRRDREGKEACDSKAIKAELLDNKVMEIFKEIKHDPKSIEKYMKTAIDLKPSESPIIRKRLDETKAKIERLTAALADMGDSTAVKYIVNQIEKLDIEQSDLKRKLNSVSAQERQYQAKLKSLDTKREEIYRLISDFDNFTMSEKNAIARSVIQSATWDGETLFLRL